MRIKAIRDLYIEVVVSVFAAAALTLFLFAARTGEITLTVNDFGEMWPEAVVTLLLLTCLIWRIFDRFRDIQFAEKVGG